MSKLALTFTGIAILILAYLAALPLLWESSVHEYESRFISAATDGNTTVGSGRLYFDNDACYWVTFAREMARTGSWRIRHTDIDNTPAGRPVHWSQSISWLLLAVGYLRNIFTGEGMFSAIEQASPWVEPLQMALLALASGILLFRRMGWAPAVAWMLNLATMTTLQWSFHPLRPDHHSLQIGFLLGSLLCLMLGGLGWVSAAEEQRGFQPRLFQPLALPSPRIARRYFLASGILGGLGLWTGATVQLFGVGVIALGAMLLIFFMPPRVKESETALDYRPELWRLWAVTGGVTSVALYLVEYAPAFPGMRLEVLHPLHALSWLCGGEIMTRLSRMKTRGIAATARDGTILALLGAGAMVLPMLLWVGPAKWHVMHDPLMKRMHAYIMEFLPYTRTYDLRLAKMLFAHFRFLPLFFLAAPFLTGNRKTTLYEWALLWMVFLPTLAYAVLLQIQVRWGGFFAVTALLQAIVTLAILAREPTGSGRPTRVAWLVLAVLLAQPVLSLREQVRGFANRRCEGYVDNDLAKDILQRQFAGRLSALNTNGNFRVLCEPDMAARLYYYGRLPSVTSYYWENVDGLRAATDFFSTTDLDEARRILEERGITHVILPRTAEIAHIFHFFKKGYLSEEGARDSMAGRMLARADTLPPWIRRDRELEKNLQPGYLFAGKPFFNTLIVFTVHPGDFPPAGSPP